MGLGSFLKNVGSKIFGGGESAEEQAQKVKDHVAKFGFDVSELNFSVEKDKVTITGFAKDWQEKHKIYVAAGNVEGIDGVNDEMNVRQVEAEVVAPVVETKFYTVEVVTLCLKLPKNCMTMLMNITKYLKQTNLCCHTQIKFILVKYW